MKQLSTPRRWPHKRPAKHLYLRTYVAIRYPDCRLDFVGPDMAMLTSPTGDQWLIRDRKPADWWSQLAMQVVPASIWLGGMFLMVMVMVAAQFVA